MNKKDIKTKNYGKKETKKKTFQNYGTNNQ